MKSIVLLLILLAIPLAAHAQSITLGTIAKTSYCVGDTMFVPYTATGTFNAGNYFFAELSDANGSFAGFTPFGNSISPNGIIPIPMTAAGNNFRVRVASSDPYDTSTNNGASIRATTKPAPSPAFVSPLGVYGIPVFPNRDINFLAVGGIVGDTLRFTEYQMAAAGSTFLWRFGQDANISMSLNQTPSVVFGSEGIKTGSLRVTSPAGCDSTDSLQLRIISCHPQIPSNTRMVKSTESGSDPSVWVLAGGNYSPSSEYWPQTIFVEPGASITITGTSSAGIGGENIYYLRSGASIKMGVQNGYGYTAVALARGMQVIFDNLRHIDTFYCPDLTFDYSQLSGSVAEDAQPAAPRISQSGERLFVSAKNAALSVRVVNVLGNEIASADGRGAVDLDLALLPVGIYFAIAEAGQQRATKKIVIGH